MSTDTRGVQVRMGCAPDVPLQRLQAFLGPLYTRQPDVDVEVRHLPTAPQAQELRDGDLDLGLIHGAGVAPGIETEPLYRGQMLMAVVPLAHRLATLRSVRLGDLAGDVLLVVPSSAEPAVHDRVTALAAADGTPFHAIRQAPGSDLRDLLFAVASASGVALAPRSTLRIAGELGDAVVARPLRPAASMPDTCVAWPARATGEMGGLHAEARQVAQALYHCS